MMMQMTIVIRLMMKVMPSGPCINSETVLTICPLSSASCQLAWLLDVHPAPCRPTQPGLKSACNHDTSLNMCASASIGPSGSSVRVTGYCLAYMHCHRPAAKLVMNGVNWMAYAR